MEQTVDIIPFIVLAGALIAVVTMLVILCIPSKTNDDPFPRTFWLEEDDHYDFMEDLLGEQWGGENVYRKELLRKREIRHKKRQEMLK